MNVCMKWTRKSDIVCSSYWHFKWGRRRHSVIVTVIILRIIIWNSVFWFNAITILTFLPTKDQINEQTTDRQTHGQTYTERNNETNSSIKHVCAKKSQINKKIKKYYCIYIFYIKNTKGKNFLLNKKELGWFEHKYSQYLYNVHWNIVKPVVLIFLANEI